MTNTTYSTKTMYIVGSIAALGILALANPAAAYYGHNRTSNDVNIGSENSATVVNEAAVVANTGSNGIDGGDSGNAGNGGDARAAGNRSQANAGTGGSTGDSNNDGAIVTGNATAIGTINNDVNSNRTNVPADCDCDDRKRGDVTVWNSNYAALANGLLVDANTGENGITGGDSGKAGNGGDATARSWSMWNHYMKKGKFGHHGMNSTEANGGNGGSTGASNNLGTVLTGESIADGLVVNVVNRNVTRVAR